MDDYYPRISQAIQKSLENRNFSCPEEACRYFLERLGIKANFLLMEQQKNPAICRSVERKFSVGVYVEHNAFHYYAVAMYVILKEQQNPGFYKEYRINEQIIEKKPDSVEIAQIELALLKVCDI